MLDTFFSLLFVVSDSYCPLTYCPIPLSNFPGTCW